MDEIWKPIKGFEGMFEVSNFGRVRRLSYDIEISSKRCKNRYVRHIEPMIKKPTQGNDGYWDIALGKDNKEKFFSIHRLVAEAFIPNPENKPTVNHIDGDKSNNCVHNLEWATPEEQMTHARKMGFLHNDHPEISRANLKRWNDAHTLVVESLDGTEKYVGVKAICENMQLSSVSVKSRIKAGKEINGKLYKFYYGIDN